MKAAFVSFPRKIVHLTGVLSLIFTFLFTQTRPVLAAGGPLPNASGAQPQSEPTPVPTAAETEPAPTFDPNSVSVTLIFDTIIKWLFGKNLIEIFNDIDLNDEQRQQIESLIGETNPVDLATNFCAQVRTGEFARMAESVRSSNQDDGSGALNPSILMDFFEQLGAFCPENSGTAPEPAQ